MRQVRRRAPAVVVILAAAALVAAVLAADGFRRAKFDLHDAGVWLTWTGQQAVGRTNTEIRQVDMRLSAKTNDFDILQSGATVLLHQKSTNHLQSIDPALGRLPNDVQLPPGAQVGLGGTEIRVAGRPAQGVTSAVLDGGSGRLWIGSGVTATEASYGEDSKPTATVEGGQLLAVGGDGTVHVLAPGAAEVVSFSGSGAEIARRPVPADLDVAGLQMAALGHRPVLLQRGSRRLIVPGGGTVDLASLGDNPVLQESGDASQDVVVAGSTTIARVGLGGGSPIEISAGGTGAPVRPVVVRGCAFGAWSSSPTYAEACPGQAVRAGALPGIRPGGKLRFRVNRDRVVVNETESGESVLVGQGDAQPLDWSQALGEKPEDASPDRPPGEASNDVQKLDREQNDPPVAKPDDVGTRPGRPILVRVLSNDTDPDGDVLVVRNLGRLAEDRGKVAIVAGGEAVQVTPAPGVERGLLGFDYTIDDGNDHTATAKVAVTVHPAGRNSPPTIGEQKTTVSAGSSVTHDVLENVTDPEGDALKLVAATVPANRGTVQFEPGGKVTYTAPAGFVGEVRLPFSVSDEFDAAADGGLTVAVTPANVNLPPTARNDHAVTFAGREVVVPVLTNDSDPDGDTLQIVRVPGHPTATFTWAPPAREIRFRAEQPGPYDIVYEMTDGAAIAAAVLRVDVLAVGDQRPPVAVRDDVVLRPGEAALVDVLANDFDANGDVLVITAVRLPAPSPVTVEVLERRFLRITATAPLTAPVELRYEVSDGSGSDTGTVVVQPGRLPAVNQPPVAEPDEITLRAGNAISVPVLANDRDPDGDALVVDGFGTLKDGEGVLFLQAGDLRYLAPPLERGSVSTTYRVRDAFGNVGAGQLVFHVTPPSPDNNRPPTAPDLTARVLAGGRVTIPVPVGSLDPDGDPVSLLGVGDSAPIKGSVVEVKPDRLLYQADRRVQGTDEFSYRVRDSFGGEAAGRVLVGIAPATAQNTPPAAVFDTAEVRPGGTVEIRVLDNDNDLDGDQLHLSEVPEDQPAPRIGKAVRIGDRITFSAPPDAPEAVKVSFGYVVDDGNGGRGNGVVEVTITSNLSNKPPIPRDDTADPQQVGQVVTVGVLDNDSDPDGGNAALRISEVLDRPGAIATPDGRKVQFTMPDRAVTFRYVVTDGQKDGTAQAVVRVPLATNRPPVAVFDPVTTDADQAVTVDVLANDTDPDGDKVQLLRVYGARNGEAHAEGDRVVFTPAPGYVGDAGFAYLIGDPPDRPGAQTAAGSARVVVSGRNTRPTCEARRVEVPAGSTAGTTIDLIGAIDDLNPDDAGRHRFEGLEGERDGVTGSLEPDGELTVKAKADVPRGTEVPLAYTVVDPGEAGKVPGCQVTVTVVKSDKPLASAVRDAAREIQGKSVEVDPTANDVNPFPDAPLRVVSAEANGGGRAEVAGNTVRFVPDADFFGQAVVTYVIDDKTADVERRVTGTITITIIGRPAAPPPPTAVSVESHTVNLGWGIPANNGAPITSYEVRSTSGATKTTTTNTLRFDGLANNQTYTFTVEATNEAGASPVSPSSPAYKPDAVPDVATAPTSRWGNTKIDVAWVAPNVDGSPIDGYTLAVSPAPPGGRATEEVTGTSFEWTGLQNGVAYSFRVKAKNAQGEATAFSPGSNPETPAGPPLQPAPPTTTKGDEEITVRWTEPGTNGDSIKSYDLQVSKAGSQEPVVTISDPSQRSMVVDTQNGVSYTFTIRAKNKAGDGAFSNPSATATSSGVPAGVGAVAATEGDTTSTLSFAEPDDNGSAITAYQYDANGANNWRALATDKVVRSLTNGTPYTFRVRAVNANGPSTTPSEDSNDVTPYGAPPSPTPTGSQRASTTTIDWSWNNPGGNGRPVSGFQFRVDGGGFGGTTGATSHSQGFGYSQTHTLCVRTITTGDAGRNTSPEACSQVAIGADPTPPLRVSITKGNNAKGTSAGICTNDSCRWMNMSVTGFPPNTLLTIECFENGATYYGPTTAFNWRTNAAGTGSWTGSESGGCFFGFPGRNVSMSANGVMSNTIVW